MHCPDDKTICFTIKTKKEMKTLKEKLTYAALAFTLLFTVNATASASNHYNELQTVQGKAYDTCEQMPSFNGKLSEWLGDNIKYPEEAAKKKIEGRVIVQFVVDKKGKACKPKVVRSIHPALDAEAIRVINAMPNWKPGTIKGKPVSVKYTIPISFKLK